MAATEEQTWKSLVYNTNITPDQVGKNLIPMILSENFTPDQVCENVFPKFVSFFF